MTITLETREAWLPLDVAEEEDESDMEVMAVKGRKYDTDTARDWRGSITGGFVCACARDGSDALFHWAWDHER